MYELWWWWRWQQQLAAPLLFCLCHVHFRSYKELKAKRKIIIWQTKQNKTTKKVERFCLREAFFERGKRLSSHRATAAPLCHRPVAKQGIFWNLKRISHRQEERRTGFWCIVALVLHRNIIYYYYYYFTISKAKEKKKKKKVNYVLICEIRLSPPLTYGWRTSYPVYPLAVF